MPKRTDIQSICIIGAGPIVIGQACEFDYSGVQACKALRAEGYRIILVNSNPATIMTDPEVADATYIEPITPEMVTKVLEKERPDAILPTMGGQTALNTAMALAKDGTLERLGIELIGAKREAIEKAEDRLLFRNAMDKIGLVSPRSCIVHTMDEAAAALADVGLPAIIRPSFTLAGTGGGIAYNKTEYQEIVASGLDASPVSEVLVEESVLGWKEYEMEVVRDTKDNCIIICSIENVDPMGIHTGDSITVAPALTLTDKEYQIMRNASIAVLREIGVDTGGSNVQFAVNPADGRMVVIEMNPRVSRSSALASKATGFPIAKVAARLAVGYTLDELMNDITGVTPAAFEPTIDYVVTKIPRFAFEKFPGTEPTLTTAMKSVGEVMAIGRTFPESLQKALRGLETGLCGLDEVTIEGQGMPALQAALAKPSADRLLVAAQALREGMSVEDICAICKYDPWFMERIAEIVREESRLKAEGLPQDKREWQRIKAMGFADARLAALTGQSESDVAAARRSADVRPVFKRIDTCAAEFASLTPYLYSCYEPSSFLSPSPCGRVEKAQLFRGGVESRTEGHDPSPKNPSPAGLDFSTLPQGEGDLGGDIFVRKANPTNEEAEGILSVHKEAILARASDSYTQEQVQAWIKANGSVDDERQRLSQKGISTYVVVKDGEIVGFARVNFGAKILQALYVRPAVAPHLGATLLNYIEGESQQASVVHLLCDSSLNAEPFYVRHGYKVVEKMDRQMPDGTMFPCVKMEKKFSLQASLQISHCEAQPSDKKKVIILGGGPNRIGQGIEFDYCCVHAVMALRAAGFEAVMVNCNPETVSTDYDTSDRLYFEPLTAEDVIEIVSVEQSKGTLLGVMVQFGGQTPLRLAEALQEAGIPILGTSPDAIDLAEDRERFQVLLQELKLKQPANGLSRSPAEAEAVAEKVGYPVVIRPSYVLGGRAMEIVHGVDGLRRYIGQAVHVSGNNPVLIDHYLENAIEVDVDVVADKDTVFVAGVMEHIEEAGIHSGDSSCALPPYSLAPDIIAEIKRQAEALARGVGVIGLMNVQFAVKDGEVYILEVNPRASRTVPFVAKAIGLPIAKMAARVMVGEKLAALIKSDVDLLKVPARMAVKTPVFPFARFPNVDIVLGPEMKSTGEVMGLDRDFAHAYAKAQLGAGLRLPKKGNCFVSVKNVDKPQTIELARRLIQMGFDMVATGGTAKALEEAGVPVRRINKVYQGQPHIVDAMINGEIDLMINTTAEGAQTLADSYSLRRTALMEGIPHYTTMAGAKAAVGAIAALQSDSLEVESLQSYPDASNR